MNTVHNTQQMFVQPGNARSVVALKLLLEHVSVNDQEEQAMERAPAPCTILIVEDDGAVRGPLCELLEDEGYAVVEAADGAEALAALGAMPRPALIILDLMMPGMNGWELYQQLQGDPQLASIPIVVLSAVAAFQQRRGKLDVAAVLPKPVNLSRLQQIVAQHCRAV